MKQITLVTGNQQKLHAARTICGQAGIQIDHTELDIVEIQSEDGLEIARDKAQKAYDQLQKPLVVCDDEWIVPGLNGFPGPYMKSMNHWLTAQNWIDLTARLTDRRAVLRQMVVYQDATQQKVFSVDITGTLLHEARGQSHNANDMVVSFNAHGLSNAEVRASGVSPIEHRHTAWHELSDWLQTA